MATPIPENHAAFSFDEIVHATGGILDGPSGDVRGVAIDSRAVEPGTLFVALRGENHDGHGFISQAVSAGAAALLIGVDADVRAEGVSAVRVADTTTALGDLAAFHRVRWGRRVVAITGSAGKTSTKELVAAALDAGNGRVAKTRGNLNNLVGVPMTLFCLDDESDVAVIEMGTSRRGEIARLGALGRPDVALITTISAAHTEGLGGLSDVAREKKALLASLGPGGIAVLNADDEQLRDVSARDHDVVLFGEDSRSDVRLMNFQIDPALRTVAGFDVRGVGSIEVRLELLGEAAAQNAGAAMAVVLALGGDVRAAAKRLEGVAPTPGRSCPRDTGSYVVIDDSYNANPRSTALALETARAVADARGVGLVAVLGDMLELGDLSREAHAEIGRLAGRSGARGLVFVGPEMAAAAVAARAQTGADGAETKISHVDDAAGAIAPARAISRRGDVVLVKGSRSMATERVVDALISEVAP